MKVLVIESPTRSSHSLEKTLLRENLNVAVVTSHEDAIQVLECFEVDIAVLHERIDGGSATNLLQSARKKGIKTPIIMATADDSKINAVEAFSAGADDFITQTVGAEELVARIQAVVRRTRGIAESIISIDDLKIDLGNKSAFAAGKPLKLTVKEYELLQALAIRKGRTVTKEALMSLLYNHDEEPEYKIIDVFICKLRKKISQALDGKTLIETVWGRGYMLSEETRHDDEDNAGMRRDQVNSYDPHSQKQRILPAHIIPSSAQARTAVSFG